jgi:hypothetical protein
MGVRSATGLLKAFDPDAAGRQGSAGQPLSSPESLVAHGLDPDQMNLLVRVLRAERGLDPIWNWKCGGPARLSPKQD